jgi:hypothetical protein
MRKVAFVVLAAYALLTTASAASAKAKRYLAPRTGPEILVVPDAYGTPQVYVRRYEALVFEYVVPRRYQVRRYATCAYPRGMAQVCKVRRRY